MRVLHTAETEVICTRADFSLPTSSDQISRAVLICAKERSTAHDTLSFGRLVGIVWRTGTLRIARHAASCGKLLVIIWSVPVTHPLPHVSRHVEEAVTVRRILCNRSDAHMPVFARIHPREMSLERVCHPFALGSKFISPHKRLAAQSSARRKLPFRLRGKTFANPFRVSFRVLESDVDNRVFLAAFEVALRSARVTPVGPRYVGPPLIVIIERHILIRRGKHDGPGKQVFRRSIWKILGFGLALGHGDIACGAHERRELFVRYVRLIHPETIDIDSVDGPRITRRLHALLPLVRSILRTHGKLSAGNPDHSFRSSARRRGVILFRGLKSIC